MSSVPSACQRSSQRGLSAFCLIQPTYCVSLQGADCPLDGDHTGWCYRPLGCQGGESGNVGFDRKTQLEYESFISARMCGCRYSCKGPWLRRQKLPGRPGPRYVAAYEECLWLGSAGYRCRRGTESKFCTKSSFWNYSLQSISYAVEVPADSEQHFCREELHHHLSHPHGHHHAFFKEKVEMIAEWIVQPNMSFSKWISNYIEQSIKKSI